MPLGRTPKRTAESAGMSLAAWAQGLEGWAFCVATAEGGVKATAGRAAPPIRARLDAASRSRRRGHRIRWSPRRASGRPPGLIAALHVRQARSVFSLTPVYGDKRA